MDRSMKKKHRHIYNRCYKCAEYLGGCPKDKDRPDVCKFTGHILRWCGCGHRRIKNA